MKKSQTLSFIALLLPFAFLYAQKPSSLFKAGVTAGVNFTQIDGDEQFGYHNKGFNYGLRGAIILRKDMDISTELLYSKRGALPDYDEVLKKRRTVYVTLHYADVPILFNYFFDKAPDGHFRWNFYTGVSYGRLVKSNTKILKGTSIDTVQQNYVNNVGYNTSDLSFIIGAKRYFTSRISLSLRHSFSMNYLYKNPAPIVVTRGTVVNRDYRTFRSYFISVNACYDFITPKLAKPRKGKTTTTNKK